VQRSCVGVDCPVGQVCANGYCYPTACSAVDCPEGYVCENDVCIEASCATVECPAGERCANGRCWPEDCPGVDCAPGEVCEEDQCVAVECVEGKCCPVGECTPADECLEEECGGDLYVCLLSGWSTTERGCDDGDPCKIDDQCSGGVCAGTDMVCDTAPPAVCKDANTVQAFAAPGRCVNGVCEYPSVDVPCPNGCANGRCLGGTCSSDSDCIPPDTCGGGGVPDVCGCTPTTCAAEGKNCDDIDDRCGGTLPCGTCTPPDTCGGGGTPNVCGNTGVCTPNETQDQPCGDCGTQTRTCDLSGQWGNWGNCTGE
jgi:hypothetical protein